MAAKVGVERPRAGAYSSSYSVAHTAYILYSSKSHGLVNQSTVYRIHFVH